MDFHLKTLELTNFMKFSHEVFDLSKNLNLIIWPNGGGKSSVLEALALSFQLKERGNSVTNYIRKGTKNASVILECEWLGKPLLIKSLFLQKGMGRKIKREVEYDGQKYEDTVANNFLAAHFKEQHNIVSFALQGKEKFISNSKAKNLQNLVDILQINFTKELSLVKDILKENYTKKETQLHQQNNIKGSLQTASESLNNFKAALVNTENALKNLKNPGFVLSDLENEILNTNTKLQNLKNVVAQNEKKKSEIVYWENEVAKTKNIITQKENELNRIPQNLTVLSTDDLEKESKEITVNLQTLNISFREKISCISALNTKIDAENKRINLFKNGICPTCERALEESQKIEMQNSLQNLLDSKVQEENIKNELSLKIKENENLSVEKQKEINNIKIKNSEVSHSIQIKEILSKDIEEKKRYLESVETKLNSLKSEIFENVDDLEMSSLNANLAALQEKKNLQMNFQNEKSLKENEIKKTLQYINEFELKVKDFEQKEKEVEEIMSSIEAEINKWNRVTDIFTNIPKIHLKNVLDDIIKVCNSIVTDFGYKDLKIIQDEKGLEFILGNWPLGDVEEADITYEMCSTFEKSLINISFIYALAKMFRVPFICIDELDANSDDANTNKLGDLVLEMLKTVPVVAVSHDSNLVAKMLQDSQSVSILKMEANRSNV